MIKTFIATALATCGIACAAAADPLHRVISISDLLVNDLNGPVKCITTDTCDNLADQHEKETLTFDSAGNLLTTIKENYKDTVIGKSTRFYDESGCLTGWETEDLEKKKTNTFTVMINLETRQVAIQNTKSGTTSIYTYSPQKYLLNGRTVDSDRKLVSAFRYERREDQKETLYVRYDENNHPTLTINYRWNDAGHIDQEIVYFNKEKTRFMLNNEFLCRRSVKVHHPWSIQNAPP